MLDEARARAAGCRAVGAGWGSFDRSVKPISTRVSRLCPPHYYLPPWIFRPSYGPAAGKISLRVTMNMR